MSFWHDVVPLNHQRRRPITGINEKPIRVKEIHHVEYRVVSVIFEWSMDLFEVRYFGDFKGSQELGWRISVLADVLTEKGKLKFTVLTFADCLESAETIACDELDTIVSKLKEQLMRHDQTDKL